MQRHKPVSSVVVGKNSVSNARSWFRSPPSSSKAAVLLFFLKNKLKFFLINALYKYGELDVCKIISSSMVIAQSSCLCGCKFDSQHLSFFLFLLVYKNFVT